MFTQKDGSERGNSKILESGKPSHGYVCRDCVIVLLIRLFTSRVALGWFLSDVNAVCASSAVLVLVRCPEGSFNCGQSEDKKSLLFMAEQLVGSRK